MATVTSVPLHVPSRTGPGPWTARAGLVAAALLSAVAAAVLHAPIAAAEPAFTLINIAVIATLVTLGLYLVTRQAERFTGYMFALAGLSWCLVSLDATYPAWGPFVAWTLAGTTYLTIGWAVLRYRRRRLTTRADRWFVPLSATLTIGTSFAAAFVVPPEALGYDPGTFWPPVLDITYAPTVAITVLCVGYLFLGLFYCLLMARMVSSAPRVSRGILRPMALFGAILGLGSAVVQTASALMPQVFDIHQAVTTVGALLLGLCAAFAVSTVLQQMVGARFLAQLPIIRTPESVSAYLQVVLGDPTAEILYRSPETGVLLEATGAPRPLPELPDADDRFTAWIVGSDGERVALLMGAPGIGADRAALDAMSRVLSIVVENTRLNVLLRMRLAELNATRAAEALAFDRAKEQFHRNLHDGLQQTIASIRLDVDGLHDVVPSADGSAVVNGVERKLDIALEQVHSLRQGGNPPEMQFGLKPAIDRTIAELRLPAVCRVPNEDLGILTLPVYYLIRESLTNVHKHARAEHVQVEVTTDGRTVDITVCDDGCGGAIVTERGGIAGMRRRVEELGGKLEVTSRSSEGTLLRGMIPRVS